MHAQSKVHSPLEESGQVRDCKDHLSRYGTRLKERIHVLYFKKKYLTRLFIQGCGVR